MKTLDEKMKETKKRDKHLYSKIKRLLKSGYTQEEAAIELGISQGKVSKVVLEYEKGVINKVPKKKLKERQSKRFMKLVATIRSGELPPDTTPKPVSYTHLTLPTICSV